MLELEDVTSTPEEVESTQGTGVYPGWEADEPGRETEIYKDSQHCCDWHNNCSLSTQKCVLRFCDTALAWY